MATNRFRPAARIGAVTLAVLVVAAPLTACTPTPAQPTPSTQSTNSGGQTVTTTLDPDRPLEPMSGLPADGDGRRDEIRRRMTTEWAALLQASGVGTHSASFGIFTAPYHPDMVNGVLDVTFAVHSQADWPAIESSMARAAAAAGWTQAGVSHALNLRKGSLHLKGGCNVTLGCFYEMDTVDIPLPVSHVPGTRTDDVPELSAFRSSTSASATSS